MNKVRSDRSDRSDRSETDWLQEKLSSWAWKILPFFLTCWIFLGELLFSTASHPKHFSAWMHFASWQKKEKKEFCWSRLVWQNYVSLIWRKPSALKPQGQKVRLEVRKVRQLKHYLITGTLTLKDWILLKITCRGHKWDWDWVCFVLFFQV